MERKFVEAYSAANLPGQAFEIGQWLGDWFFRNGWVCLGLSSSDSALVIDHLWQHGELTAR